jgi:hypothetical protein
VLIPSIFLVEFIVSTYYWIMIAPNKPNPLKRGDYLDHAVPFLLLSFDYFLLSAYPMIGKHVIVIIILSVSYLITNCTVTLVTGEVVYTGMDWRSVVGIIFPIAIALVSLFLFVCLLKINECKLRSLDAGQPQQKSEEENKL